MSLVMSHWSNEFHFCREFGGIKDGGIKDRGIKDGGITDGGIKDGGIKDTNFFQIFLSPEGFIFCRDLGA